MPCPQCNHELESGFLYVRGFGSSLCWGWDSTTGFLSRRGLEQIDLTNMSVTGTASQGVPQAKRCTGCSAIVFESI